VQLFLEVVAHKLPHAHKCLLLEIEHFLVDEDVGVLVDAEHVPDLDDFIFDLLEELALHFLEMEFAHYRSFVLDCAQDSFLQLRII
jgi:hypothetical protein